MGIRYTIPKVGISGLATGPVLGRFEQSTSLVELYEEQSADLLDALSAADFTAETISTDFVEEVEPDPGDRPAVVRPAGYESVATPVAFPDLVALRDQLGLVETTIEQVTLPTLDVVAPGLSLPDAPTDSIPDIPTDVPVVADPELPVAPSYNIPEVPVLADVAVPSAPELVNPVFDAVLPTTDLTPPDPMFVYNEGTYDSNVADALRTKLYQDITFGGTGLESDVEEAIFDRASDRLEYELTKDYNAELNNWEAWNFEVPDGFLAANLREVLGEGTRRRAELNRDVLTKQAELAQENTKFAITSGLEHEQQLMTFTNQIAQRAFEVAKTTYGAVLDVFRAKVEVYLAQLEGYKSQASVFESRIRAELAKVEIFKAQMEGAKIAGELNAQKLDVYTKRVEAVQTLIDLYKVNMEGVRLRTEVDRVRIEGFRAVLDAKRAQIDGVTAKYNLYQAQLAGEQAKVDIYSAQVSAFGEVVAAKKIESDINLAELQAAIEGNRDKVAMLVAAVDKYKADTQYQASREDASTKAYSSEVAAYGADADRERAYVAGLVDTFRARVSQATAKAELLLKEADSNLRAATALKEIQIEALKGGANISAQKVASALASVSASAALGFSESVSNSYNGSESRSASSTTATSESKSHIWDETKSIPQG